MSVTKSPDPVAAAIDVELSSCVSDWATKNDMSFVDAVHELLRWHFCPGTELTKDSA